MPVYHVSFDLKQEYQNYAVKRARVTAELKRKEHLHIMGSTYLISTPETAAQLAAPLTPMLDANDRLLISAIRPPVGTSYGGWVSPEEGKWIGLRVQ